ncbi:U3 small nucleolar RNA-associated protein 18 homolog isoform X1 [Nelusetta ayraudi]|uniref:U3 small nucleolar RNA-associated protein 18 homolog isoform X1 n=1 Tax=Nelusetta ayraudi TaxID=303726 RepID=UPI003F716E6F
MGDVIPLPVTKQRPAAKKRPRVRAPEPEEQRRQQEQEEHKRRRNVQCVAVLGEEDASVRQLEELLFGAEERLVEQLEEEQEEQEEQQEGGDDESDQSEGEAEAQRREGPAWVDEDDELEEEVDMKHRYRRDLARGEAESSMSQQRLQSRMREQFAKSMGGTPSWAEPGLQRKKKKKRKGDDGDDDEEEDEDEEDDLLRRTGNFVGASHSLPSGILRMKKCLRVNSARPSEGRLTSVQFHPSAQVALTAGLDQSVSLFQVDGKSNPKIQSIHLERFPVHSALFSRDGESLFATSLRNKMFYTYHMMEGRVEPVHCIRGLNEARVKDFSVCPEGGALLLTGTRGYLHLLSLKTKEVVRSVKINGDVSGVAFSPDGKVFVHSEQGQVCVWDVRGSSRCVSSFLDDGCVRGTSIAASPDGRYLACGSQSGVVNIYSQEACLTSANPRPLKSLMNLLTPATSMTFNPTSEILAVASRAEDGAVRLVHLPSFTVFSNFPANKAAVQQANCLAFSPHSGFFSLANNKGHAPLFRLLHYKDF